MPTFRDEGLVLRTHQLGETDRIITLLTKDHGKVRAVAKGIRRPKSKFGARLETFNHVDLLLYEGRNLDTITQAVLLDPYAETMANDYTSFTCAKAMVEAVDRLVVEDKQPAVRQYRLLWGALHALHAQDRSAALVLDSYLLRAMATAGYAPALRDCAVCGRGGPHAAFAPASGGAVCESCRPHDTAFPTEETWTHLAALFAGDWPVVLLATEATCRQSSGLIAAFVTFHLERRLRSLPFVDR